MVPRSLSALEDLRIFQLAREICLLVWEITRRPDVACDKGIVRQMLNSSGSMMDNPAEGHGRGSNNEFKTFLAYGLASGNELLSQCIRLRDRNSISEAEFNDIEARITSYRKQTSALIKSLKSSNYRGSRMK